MWETSIRDTVILPKAVLVERMHNKGNTIGKKDPELWIYLRKKQVIT